MFEQFFSPLKTAWNRKQRERDMDDELRFHMDAYASDLERSGTSRDEAMRMAKLHFGAMENTKEECRSAMGVSWWDEFLRNLRYSARVLRRTPGFAIAVVATLALCIGANTVIFSIVDAVMFRALPFADPESLGEIAVHVRARGGEGFQNGHEGTMWFALKQAKSLELAASSAAATGVNLAKQGTALYLQQHRISAGYFHVLGIAPVVGREFSENEDRPGGAAVAILSYETWMNVFAGDPRLIGTTILLRGEPFQVVGIMPARFRPMIPADVWTPLRPMRTGEGGGQNYRVIARLHSGSTWAEAEGEVAALGQPALQERRYSPETVAQFKISLLQQARARRLERSLKLLWACVGVVLLIGCVNIAGLLLARSAARSREMATRVVMGGGQAAMMRQVLTESLLLALLGGVAGICAGYWCLEGIRAVALQNGIWQEIRMDWRVAGMALGLSILTSLIFGSVPALQAARVELRSTLFEGGSRGVAGSRSRRSRHALVMVQVALGVSLLVASGLFIRTLRHLEGLTPGFDERGVLTAALSLHDARYESTDRVVWLYDRTLADIRAIRGVQAAGAGLHVPYQSWVNAGADVVDGPAARLGMSMTSANYVTPGYLETLRIPVLSGRSIDERDTFQSAPVAIVSQAFVRKFLRDQEPLGSHVKSRLDGTTRLIVGVVGDVQQRPTFGNFGPLGAPPAMYIPLTQLSDQVVQLVHTWFSPRWVVRGSRSLDVMIPEVKRAVEKTDPMLPIAEFDTFETVRDQALRMQQLQTFLLSALAAIALGLAAVGVYGLVAHAVTERTREMGIRMALGGSIRQVILSAALPGISLAAGGLAIGLCFSLAMSRLLEGLIYGITPFDPGTFLVVACVLLAIAVTASLLPALRLVRLDPATTLRQD